MNKTLLQQEAFKIIKELNLFKLLNAVGEARLVGSVALDLIVKLDIDIHVFINHGKLINAANYVYTRLLNDPRVEEVRISDYRKLKSIKIGIDKFSKKSRDWSIDIWLTKDKKAAGFKQTDEMLKKLTPAYRNYILKIKAYYNNKGLLRNSLSSAIYYAVLNEGVKTVKEFKQLQ